jgi:hypothetical protein
VSVISEKTMRYVLLGVGLVILLAAAGAGIILVRPYLPDGIDFRNGRVTLYYVLPYPN